MLKLSSLVSELSRNPAPKGELGIEIECEVDGPASESPDTPSDQVQKLISRSKGMKSFWRTTGEGSLRNGIEYVLAQPIDEKDLPTALKQWSKLTSVEGITLRPSLRTSVHIHRNVTLYTVAEVYNVLAIYWLLENALVKLNGPEREGNLFCLRIGDAEAEFEAIVSDARHGEYFVSNQKGNDHRYSACNLTALWKFGSLEFRFIKGLIHPENILKWAVAMNRLVKQARTANVQQELKNVVYGDYEKFLHTYLPGDLAEAIRRMPHSRELSIQNYCYVFRLLKALQNPRVRSFRRVTEDQDTSDLAALRRAPKSPELKGKASLEEAVKEFDIMDEFSPPPLSWGLEEVQPPPLKFKAKSSFSPSWISSKDDGN